MLVLTRKINESIVIGDDITVTVTSINGDKVRIGISAPADVAVDREEIHRAKSWGAGPDDGDGRAS